MNKESKEGMTMKRIILILSLVLCLVFCLLCAAGAEDNVISADAGTVTVRLGSPAAAAGSGEKLDFVMRPDSLKAIDQKAYRQGSADIGCLGGGYGAEGRVSSLEAVKEPDFLTPVAKETIGKSALGGGVRLSGEDEKPLKFEQLDKAAYGACVADKKAALLDGQETVGGGMIIHVEPPAAPEVED